MEPKEKTKKKLLVDLETCYSCREGGACRARCSYFYSSRGPHELASAAHGYTAGLPASNNGVEKLLAKAQQYLVCRRCENPFCVNSCPNEALEKNSEGILQRNLFRCTSCKTCSIACPFGTIYPEILGFKSSSCDYCAGRSGDNTPPLCVTSCKHNALKFTEVPEEIKDKHLYIVNEHLAVCVPKWNKVK